MVTITSNLLIAGDPNLTIYSPAGDYADTDLILCAEKLNPSVATVQLQAQYIKYGPVVYQYNTPEELGAALFVLDPDSTHDAVLLYKEEEARKAARNKGTLTPTDPVPTPDSPDTTSAIPESEEPDVQFFKEQDQQNSATSTPQTDTTEPEMPIIDAGETLGVSTSTDPVIPAPDLPPVALDTSTTTPDVVPITPPSELPPTDSASTTIE